jgi:hypothetical protein
MVASSPDATLAAVRAGCLCQEPCYSTRAGCGDCQTGTAGSLMNNKLGCGTTSAAVCTVNPGVPRFPVVLARSISPVTAAVMAVLYAAWVAWAAWTCKSVARRRLTAFAHALLRKTEERANGPALFFAPVWACATKPLSRWFSAVGVCVTCNHSCPSGNLRANKGKLLP